MSNISEMNQELVKAFNVGVCYSDVARTNLKVQNVYRGSCNKGHIVISFDKSMNSSQCMEYLNNVKARVIETFCGNESTASISFDTDFFPFYFNEKQLYRDGKECKFLVPIDKGVTFNLKCYLVHELAKDIKEDMGNNFGEGCMTGRVYDISFDRKSYLYCMRFHDKGLQKYFVESFSSKIKDYKKGPKKTNDFLKIKNNCVYIKASIFDKIEFIEEIVKGKTSLICRDFQVPSSEDEVVESLKFPIIDLLRRMGVPIDSILHTSYIDSGENSVLIPTIMEVISNIKYYDFLSKEEVDYINNVFGMNVLNDVKGYTPLKHLLVSSREIYGIDFSNPEISHCVINKIIENSVINENHELSIDHELRFRALLPFDGKDGGSPNSSVDELWVSPRQGSEERRTKGIVPGDARYNRFE